MINSLPLITIFAVPKPFDNHIAVIQRNAIVSWTKLQPSPEIILCANELGTALIAEELNLKHLPDISCNYQKTPILKDIFAKVHQSSTSSILVYVNCDIILTQDFILAMAKVVSCYERFLMLGRRWNLDIKEIINFNHPHWQEILQKQVKTSGIFSGIGALDYFVFPKPLFAELPPFAIGRPGWDNWMVGHALKNNYPVINGSQAITAIHQNHDYNHLVGKRLEAFHGIEAQQNQALLRGNFAGSSADATVYLTADYSLTISSQATPKISIILFLDKQSNNWQSSLKTIEKQDYLNYEIIVIDSDNLKQEFIKQNFLFSCLIYEHQPDLDIITGWNYGISKATGELIIFLDNNSILLPHALSEYAAIFNSRCGSLEIAFSGWELINQQQQTIKTIESWKILQQLLLGREGVQGLHIWMLPTLAKTLNSSAVCFNLNWLQSQGQFDKNLTPHFALLDLILKLFSKGAAGACIEKITISYYHQDIALKYISQNLEYLLNKFFNYTHLPQWTKSLQDQAYYNNYLWLAWLHYQYQDFNLMKKYLHLSLKYTRNSALETYTHWLNSFKQFSHQDNQVFFPNMVHSLPEFQELMNINISLL